MPQVRTWFADEPDVTQRNIWARLYFEPGRTRLMLDDGFFDFAQLRDKTLAQNWCKSNGVEFFDHRPERLPVSLRDMLRRARAAGMGELRELKSRWRLIPFVGARMFLPQLDGVPSWNQAKALRPLNTTTTTTNRPRRGRPPGKRSDKILLTSDDGGKTWYPA